MRSKIIMLIGAVLLLQQEAIATGQAPWAPVACKVLTQGSATIGKVTKMAIGPFDPAGSSNMMEISGNAGTRPISIRFKIVKDPCPGCTQVEQNRVDSTALCLDNAKIAMALNKPLQFLENGAGALCDISPDNTNHKIYEIRDSTTGSTLIPPGTCAVGTLNGVTTIFFPDDSAIAD